MEIEPNSAEDFEIRIANLVHEAYGYGVHCVAVVQGDDPISRTGFFRSISSSDPVRQAGLLQIALWKLEVVAKQVP